MARTARDVARRALRRVDRERAFINRALDAEIAAAGLGARERRLATELAYGVCRHRSRIDRALAAKIKRGLGKVNPKMLTILRLGAYQILFLDRVPDHAAVSDAVMAAKRLGGGPLSGFANGVLRALTRVGEPAIPGWQSGQGDVREHIAIACSLPGWIAANLAERFDRDDEVVRAAERLNRPAKLAIRVNQARLDASDPVAPDGALAALRQRLADDHPRAVMQPSEVCPGALLVTGLGDPLRSSSFTEGLWTVQDIGAQLVTYFLAASPTPTGASGAEPEPIRILDACAGVGGKTTHLAELHRDRARIDAVDISPRKLELLQDNATRLGVAHHIATHVRDLGEPEPGDPRDAGLGAHYDAVLLDAPCTGLGVIRRHPESKWRAEESDIARMAELQRTLLETVCGLVRPGGVLLYAVCTFTRDEGRGLIADFLSEHPEFRLAAPEPPTADQDTADQDTAPGAIPWSELCPEPGILTTWPHRHDADAFFAARMIRRDAV